MVRQSTQVRQLNDQIQDIIFQKSGALYPSVYTFDIEREARWSTISTMLRETNRVNLKNLPVLPYFWYRLVYLKS